MRPKHGVKNLVERLKRFVGFAIGQHNVHQPLTGCCQNLTHSLAEQVLYRGVGDQHNRGGVGGDGLGEAFEPARGDVNGILPAWGRDSYGVHGLFSGGWLAVKSARMFSEEFSGWRFAC